MTRRGEPVTDEQGELWEGDYVLTADEQRTLRPFIQRALGAGSELFWCMFLTGFGFIQ